MWFTVENVDTRVSKHTEEEAAWLDHFLGFPDPSARFRHRGRGDGRRAMLNAFAMTFPTGLLDVVRAGAKEAGVKVELLDLRKPPCSPDPTADLGWLFDYQEEAVEVGAQKHRGVFHCPTGSGKTEVLVALALVYKCPWGVFVPSKSLLNQTRDRFNERAGGEAAGVIGDGVWNPQRVTVATFQTVYRGLCAREPRVMAWLDSLRGVTGDEIHTVAADSFWQTFGACRKAHFRFGTSATPFARTDRKGLLVMAATGPTIYRIAPAVLVAKGAIARPRVRLAAFAHAHREMAALRAARATYGEAYEAAIAASPARLAASLRLVAQAAKPTLVFVRALEHGQTLTRALAKAGTAAEFVWGAKNTPQREAAVRRLVHGDIDVLVANVVFQVGVDIPELMSVVNLAGGKSHIAALQQAGRGSRRRDRRGDVVKDQFEVWDLADKGCGCRAPGTQSYTHAACRWFEAHTRARKRAYLGEGYEVVEV